MSGSSAIDQYITLLKAQNKITNLFSKSAYDHLPFHIQDSCHIAALTKDEPCVIDLGSGSGLPSVICAIENKKQRVIAIESKKKKQQFLELVKHQLQLDNFEVYPEDIQHFISHRHDISGAYTAKALAPKEKVIKLVNKMVKTSAKLIIPMSENQIKIMGEEETKIHYRNF